MLDEVGVHELVECQPTGDPLLTSKPLELAFERVTRALLGGKSASLHALRAAPAGPVAVGPQVLARWAMAFQLERLSLLHHC
jgi:hypothetical protein